MPSTNPPRVSARRQATRDRVLEAASQVFAERGFHGASVEDICERAGFTRGAFYSNFASKDDLVLELSSRHSEQVVARIREAAAAPGSAPQDVLRDVLAALAEDQGTDRWLVLTTEFTLHAIRDTDARRAWSQQQQQIRNELISAVDEAVRARGTRLPVPTDLFVRAALALSQGSMSQRLVEPGSLSPGELERTVLPLLLGTDET